MSFRNEEDGWNLRWIQDAEGASGVVDRKNGADGAAPFVAGFAVTNSLRAIQTDGFGQLLRDRLRLTRRSETRIRSVT